MKKADLTYLLTMTDGNNELILEIIDIFVVQIEEIWTQMEVFYLKKDYNSLGKLAHKAKSSVAIVGMTATSENLKKLEKLCMEEKNIEMYQEIISNFKSDCIVVIQELLEYKRNNSFNKI